MSQSGSVLAAARPSRSTPPPIERLIAPRPRLTTRLDAAIRTSPVVIVSGEAGAGKTTLVADWVGWPSVRGAVCWRSLRRGRSAVAELDDLRGGAGGYRVVVLDDVPVEPNDELDAALERLLLGASQGFSLVLLSSGGPALDLQRLGVGAQCWAIDSTGLALDAEEIETTLTRFGIAADIGLITAIADRTQGWAWGIRSVTCRLARAASPTEALHEAELAIADYLENSILRGLLPHERRLITETSMVGEVTAEQVISLAGDHRLLSLATVTRTRGFVQVRADGSFTTHPLLRRHLLTQLRRNPTSARTATRHAVRCAVSRGDLPTAVDIAVDGADWACAAELLVESLQVPRLLIEGPALPGRDDVVDGLGAADPVLRAAAALGRSWPDVAEQALTEITAEQALTEITAEQALTEVADTGTTAMQLSRALVAMSLARWQGEPAAGLAEHRRAAALLPRLSVAQRSATPELIPLLHANLAAFELANGAPDRAKVSLERGARAFRPKPTSETSVATQVAAADCLGQLAWLEAVNGDLTSALRRAADVLTARPADSNEVGVVYAQLASVWCQVSRMELEPAAQRFESVTTRQSAPPGGAQLPELAVAIGLTGARLAAAVGHGRIGYEIRRLCKSSSGGWQFDQQLRQIRAEAELDAGEPAAALRVLADSGHQSADVYVLRARAWIQLGDRASVASALRVRPVEALSLLTQVQLELVEAWLAQAHGDQARLRSLVDRALRAAQREQLRAAISWAKPWLHDVVTADYRLLRLHGPFLASVRRNQPGPVENVARATSTAPPVSALTEREIDILQRLGALSTNEEIAADLYLSPNTIKTHLRSLYRKLDVTRRSDAFRRGRALGLC